MNQGLRVRDVAYKEFLARFGAAIRARRKELKKSQTALAADMDVEQSSISQLENGVQGFDASTLYRLSTRLEKPLSEIFAEVEGRKDYGLPAEAVAFAQAWLTLPNEVRTSYKARIEALAKAYGQPVPDERQTGEWKVAKRIKPRRVTR